MERSQVLLNVIKWNERSLRKAQAEKDAAGIDRFTKNINSLNEQRAHALAKELV